jgi:hypothetical protein
MYIFEIENPLVESSEEQNLSSTIERDLSDVLNFYFCILEN